MEVVEVEETMSFDTGDVGMIAGFLVVSFAVWWALNERRLEQLAPLLAVCVALISNYMFNGLAGAGLIEIVVRWLLAFVALRLTGSAAKRVSEGLPAAMTFATQSPAAIEFEEVK